MPVWCASVISFPTIKTVINICLYTHGIEYDGLTVCFAQCRVRALCPTMQVNWTLLLRTKGASRQLVSCTRATGASRLWGSHWWLGSWMGPRVCRTACLGTWMGRAFTSWRCGTSWIMFTDWLLSRSSMAGICRASRSGLGNGQLMPWHTISRGGGVRVKHRGGCMRSLVTRTLGHFAARNFPESMVEITIVGFVKIYGYNNGLERVCNYTLAFWPSIIFDRPRDSASLFVPFTVRWTESYIYPSLIDTF